MSAAHRFNNDLRYRGDDHEMQRQLTPRYILEPIREALGGSIGLDPCTEPDNPTNAVKFYTPPTDGASEPWGLWTIFVNPPYGKARERWVNRCIEAGAYGSQVILLMPSHTDTRLFHRAIESASHVVFIKGRVKFGVLRANRRQEAASHPSCLIAWNLKNPDPLRVLGSVWELRREGGEGAMSEHTPLTEAERIELGRVLNRLLDDDSSGPLEWHPCDGCQNGPCPCSGTTYLGPEMTAAVERILAVRTSTAAADTGLRERVEALHGKTHWCFNEDEQDNVYERGTEWWPCPTLAALDANAAPTIDTGARDE